MDLGLAGKTVLVSGASRGIGLAVARAFLAEGAGVAIAARGREGLAAAMSDLSELGPVVPVCADMTDEASIIASLDEAEAALGPLDMVVANVGSGAGLPGYNLPQAEWQRVAQVNLFGAVTLAGHSIDCMAGRGGSVTMISSIAGLEAIGAPVAYAAAKAGLNAAVKSLARQAAPLDVRVNAVAPGNVLFPGGTWDRKMQDAPEAVAALLRDHVPQGRLADPREIADVVVFLASPRASFVCGSVWTVDGGQTRAI